MTQEFEALHANQIWDLVYLPAGKKTIGCIWVYKIKHKDDGSVERFKARLIVKRYTQQAGVDYTETFSPVVKMTTITTLINVAIKKGCKLYQLDVNNTFLQGDLHEEVYMEALQGLDMETPQLVCKLNKYLYGSKQASRKWYANSQKHYIQKDLCIQLKMINSFYKKSSTS